MNSLLNLIITALQAKKETPATAKDSTGKSNKKVDASQSRSTSSGRSAKSYSPEEHFYGRQIPKQPVQGPQKPYDLLDDLKTQRENHWRSFDERRRLEELKELEYMMDKEMLRRFHPSYDPNPEFAHSIAREQEARGRGTLQASFSTGLKMSLNGFNRMVASLADVSNMRATLKETGATDEQIRAYEAAMSQLVLGLAGGGAGGATSRAINGFQQFMQGAEIASVLTNPKATQAQKRDAVNGGILAFLMTTKPGMTLISRATTDPVKWLRGQYAPTTIPDFGKTQGPLNSISRNDWFDIAAMSTNELGQALLKRPTENPAPRTSGASPQERSGLVSSIRQSIHRERLAAEAEVRGATDKGNQLIRSATKANKAHAAATARALVEGAKARKLAIDKALREEESALVRFEIAVRKGLKPPRLSTQSSKRADLYGKLQ
jgi:hypothetical protein